MTIIEAMTNRHMVRKYTDQRIPREIVQQLTQRINENNEKYGLNMLLIIEKDDAIMGMMKLFMAKGVHNYIALVGKEQPDLDEKLGYCGIDVALYAQTLGLNSWWVSGTFNRKKVAQSAEATDDAKVTGIIAIGYGATQGVPHKSKKPEEISSYNGTAPEWFIKGIDTVLLAPTAMNKQAFQIRGNDDTVSITCDSGVFSGIVLGIAKYHFEVGAGKENFKWA